MAENQELRERRNQLRHPVYAKPCLVATGPNQVWTWDITKLPGPVKWAYFCLYVVLDLFSRFVVGWLIAARESAAIAQQLITESYVRQGLAREQLSIHSDRGGPMIAGSLTALLDGLGITPSLARPRTPATRDNPYSEAQFKTVNRQIPSHFPRSVWLPVGRPRLGAAAVSLVQLPTLPYGPRPDTCTCSAGASVTPAAVHFGQAPALFRGRQQVLATAYATHPERFVRGVPQPPALPTEVWINQPEPAEKVRGDTAQRH